MKLPSDVSGHALVAALCRDISIPARKAFACRDLERHLKSVAGHKSADKQAILSSIR